MEQANLTTPEVKPTNTHWKIERVLLDWSTEAIHVSLTGANNEAKFHSYHGNTATTLLRQLNIANLAGQSLHKRILNRLITDGIISGTVTGAPD